MNDLVIKRIAAGIIDYYILNFVYGVIGTYRLLSNFTVMTNPLAFLEFMKNYTVWAIITFVIYCFILDCFVKLDLGKRLTKIEILYDNSKPIIYTRLMHSILKILCCVIFPISIIYYIVQKKMIYDEYLGITVRDRKM